MIYKLNLKLPSVFSTSRQRKLLNKQHKQTGIEIKSSGKGLETAYFIFKTSITKRLDNNTE